MSKKDDIILNGEREFKQEEQFDQLTADTQQLQDARPSFRLMEKSVPPGAPAPDSNIQYTFQTRPFGSIDFNIIVTKVITAANTFCTFTVPPSYVCMLREISGNLLTAVPISTGAGDSISSSAIKYSLGITDYSATAQYNTNVPVANLSAVASTGLSAVVYNTEKLTVYLMADEGQGITCTVASSPSIIAAGTSFVMHFYGQFVPKTGRPINFENGNRSLHSYNNIRQRIA
jgi:hypothetical protein